MPGSFATHYELVPQVETLLRNERNMMAAALHMPLVSSASVS